MGNVCERRASDPEKASKAKEFRKRGNEFFKKQEFLQAAAEYTEAITLLPKEAALYVNRSIAYRQLNLFQQAADDAVQALELEPANEKAHYGKALALKHLGKRPEAMEACKAGLVHQPDNKPLLELKEGLETLRQRAAPLAGQAEKAAAAPKPKPAPKKEAPKKKDYNVDYSKWKDINSDSEEEADRPVQGPQDPNRPALAEINPTGKVKPYKDYNQEERAYIVDEMMKMVKKVREGSLNEMQTCAANDPNIGTDFESKLTGMGQGPTITTKNLPSDYRKPLGIITEEDLAKYSASADRNLVSVYGDIFDVSNRVDVYGCGKKSTWSGRDVTWALIIGDESNSKFNQFYDIFKLTDDKLERFMRVIAHFLVSYTDEHGKPVGRLDKFEHEGDLPAPPDEECVDPCKQQ